MLAIQEKAELFQELLQDQKYLEACDLLADDFKYSTPKCKFNSKDDWLQGFPKVHKSLPEILFGEFEEGDSSNRIQRKGKRKIAFMNVTIKQVLEVDDEGKIKSITASLA